MVKQPPLIFIQVVICGTKPILLLLDIVRLSEEPAAALATETAPAI